MKAKMKILHSVQKNLALMGFCPNQQQNSRGIFNKRKTRWICSFALITSLISVYFVHVADSREAYMSSLFTLLIAATTTASLFTVFNKNNQIFHTIDLLENLMNEREFEFHYYMPKI